LQAQHGAERIALYAATHTATFSDFASADDAVRFLTRHGWKKLGTLDKLVPQSVRLIAGTAVGLPRGVYVVVWKDAESPTTKSRNASRQLWRPPAFYGREAPIALQAVYIAPPDDRRKDRFHSHQAAVIRQLGAFAPGAEPDRFVSRIKEVCT
jgi:hypothetical protein